MKVRKKIIVAVFAIWILSSAVSYAQDYILFYGNGCPHCKKVEDFIKENKITDKIDLVQKEVFFNKTNLEELKWHMLKHNLTFDKIGVPFLVITSGADCNYVNGDQNIIDYLTQTLAAQGFTCKDTSFTGDVAATDVSLGKRLSFFGVMLPAAISDSINPCAFAVMLLLLSTILTKHKSRRKTILSGLMFGLAVFVTYLAMWIGIFSALASSANTFYLKLVVGILWLLVWLANIKDFFRYGKWFVMEVPFSRRPKMGDLISKVASPWGAFAIGVVVSLFLLPCSSGPYFTILWFLSAESKSLNLRGYIYLIVYNLIFVLPMVAISIMVAYGYKSVDQLAQVKHKNTKLIHLIVGLLMLGLWIYVLTTL